MSYGRPPPRIDGMISLKVGNLTYRTTPEDLRRVFEKFGSVGDIYIPKDRFSRESRGFAFVRLGRVSLSSCFPKEAKMSFGRPPPRIEGMVSLKVDNLTYRTTPEDLRRVFERCGEVGDIYIPRDRFSRESRGFAFVRFYDKRDAEDALDAMDGRLLDGRELRVQMARYGRPSSPYRRHSRRRSANRLDSTSTTVFKLEQTDSNGVIPKEGNDTLLVCVVSACPDRGLDATFTAGVTHALVMSTGLAPVQGDAAEPGAAAVPAHVIPAPGRGAAPIHAVAAVPAPVQTARVLVGSLTHEANLRVKARASHAPSPSDQVDG
ncbi:hypothetical protein C0J52_31487 [Blattella germanica]|nr:hypothetical protein C0J52_31487 [Blattella germanica]